jgi:hypothetical protein
MKPPFPATVWSEGKWRVSHLDLDVASQGETEALANRKEATELLFEPLQVPRPPAVRMIEVAVGAA